MNELTEAYNRCVEKPTCKEIRAKMGQPDPNYMKLLQALRDPQITAEEYEALVRRAQLGLSVDLPDTSGRQLALKFT